MPVTVPKTWTDKRSHARRQPTLGTVCRLDPQDGQSAGIGLVWNISAGGMSMLTTDRVERGTTVRGMLATSTDGYSLPITLRVAHVALLQTGDYLIGGPFARPLASDEMGHFVAELRAVR